MKSLVAFASLLLLVSTSLAAPPNMVVFLVNDMGWQDTSVPTLLGVAGAAGEVPADHPVDGRDIRPYLAQRGSDPERPIYFHYPHVWGPHGPGYEPHSAGVFGPWKVTYFYAEKRWELYNLTGDLGEEHDLAQAEPERLRALATRLVDGLRAMGAQWPTDRATGKELPPELPAN